jgi:hypothetical protein
MNYQRIDVYIEKFLLHVCDVCEIADMYMMLPGRKTVSNDCQVTQVD